MSIWESRRFQRIAPWLFGIAIAIAALGLIVAVQLNASRQAAKIAAPGANIVVPFTGFGGYSWSGTVSTISTEFRVPSIAGSSPSGVASTWIGVQNDVNNQFVQVGVNENDFGDGPNQYQAFWSDLDVGFSPQTFGEVYPGDLVSVSMSRNARGWSLHFVDESRKLKGKKFVSMSPTTPFTQGEWIQEDPSPSTTTAQDLPYPKLSPTEFQDLDVNGSAPKMNLGDASVLIASDGSIHVPTLVRDDSFSLTVPSGVARQYLDDEQVLDAALNKFALELSTWRTASVVAEARYVASFSNAVRSNRRALSTQSWPTSSRAAVARLVQSDHAEIENLATWINDGYSTGGSEFLAFKVVLNDNAQRASDLRATLGLPPL